MFKEKLMINKKTIVICLMVLGTIIYINRTYAAPNYSYEVNNNTVPEYNLNSNFVKIIRGDKSAYNPYRPEWTEFCPLGLENPVYDGERYFLYHKKANQENNNYWYNRKQKFNEAIKKCDAVDDLVYKNICYSKIRDRENNLNISRQNEVAYQRQQREQQVNFQRMYQLQTAPRQLNIWHYGSVNHSGTINHNVRW